MGSGGMLWGQAWTRTSAEQRAEAEMTQEERLVQAPARRDAAPFAKFAPPHRGLPSWLHFKTRALVLQE